MEPSPPPQKETYTMDEAIRRIGCSRSTGYLAARRGELPVIRLGRKILVSRVALDRMLAGGASLTQSPHAGGHITT
jgi:excisionase family DNA binding protein